MSKGRNVEGNSKENIGSFWVRLASKKSQGERTIGVSQVGL